MQKKFIFIQNSNQSSQKYYKRRNYSLLNHNNSPIKPENSQVPYHKTQEKYKFYIGYGNNGDIIRKVLSNRSNWVETTDLKSSYINFKWQQTNKGFRYENIGSKKGFQQLLNHFEFHEQLSNKQYLLKNLMQYCEHLKKNAFQIVPPTFILNINQSCIDSNLNLFLKFFETNLPQSLKKQNRKFWLFIKSKNMNYSQLQKKNIYFFCKPVISDVFVAKNSNYIWILKPTFLNRGRGIHVFNDLNTLQNLMNSYISGREQSNSIGKNTDFQLRNLQLSKIIKTTQQKTPIKMLNNTNHNLSVIKANSFIIQKYIEKPLLINGRKFDIRVWVLWSHDSRIYFFKEGYLRTSSQQYKTDLKNLDNPFVHLTNNAVQKNNRSYSRHEPGNQLSFKTLQELFNKYGFKFHQMIKNMKQMIISTTTSVRKKINRLDRNLCFEIFGYDFMVDQNSKLWLIQVNTNPCIEQSSPLLEKLLPRMIDDAFKLTLDVIFPSGQYINNSQSRYRVNNYDNYQNMWELLIQYKK